MSKRCLKITFLILHLIICSSNAQTVHTLIGARSNSLAYASGCIEDEWALFNNVGGLAKVKNVSSSFTYDVNPTFQSFNRMAALFCLPISWGVAGLGIYRFGDDLYNEQLISFGFANTFGIASLGLKGNYIQYYIEGFGSKQIVTVGFGGVARLTPYLSVGAHIENINPPDVSEHDQVPTIVSVAIAYAPSEKIFLTTEIEKDLQSKPMWKSGFEYFLHKKIAARTGYIPDPQTALFGIGVKPKKFSLDYCIQYNNNLGLSHQATATYHFKSKAK